MPHLLVRLAGFLALLGLSASVSGASVALSPQTELTISNKVIAPDGVARDAVVVNGIHPGPLIKGYKGDHFRINVVDKMTNQTMLTETTVHWHGIHQHKTNWADGPAWVTQCPIAAEHDFLYEFSVPDQAGTFWYHSHIHTQYCDGLRGPLILYDKHDPHAHLYDVDDESTIISLMDWYHLASVNVPIPAVADSTLINGLGRWPGNPTAELAVINVQHGKRYRFRLISMSCDPNYNFTIDGHQMTIIEADGENTEPLTVDKIQIFSAQRYSIVVVANQTVDNYWIRANPDNIAQQGFANGINSAILRYKGAPDAEPTTNQTESVLPLNESDLHVLTNPAAPGLPHPGGVDVALNLALGFDFSTGEFSMNGAPFFPPSIPVLLQILSGNMSAQSLLPAGSVITLPRNASIELSIPAGVVGGPHPFHLHGHSFSVVRSAGSDVYNYDNPVKRDTVNIGDTGDNVTIRFTTDNPGPWFFHCHVDFHLNTGLAIIFAEDVPGTAAVNPVPVDWNELCPIYDAEYGTSDLIYPTPLPLNTATLSTTTIFPTFTSGSTTTSTRKSTTASTTISASN
ncbi:laccase [Fomes fomentarius]|nr:laccase [Fomes fomentarius]